MARSFTASAAYKCSHKGVHAFAEFSDREQHPLRHQPSDKGDVPRRAVELGDRR